MRRHRQFNARAETVTEKPTGKPAMQDHAKFGSCCKSMVAAMSFPGVRHFFVEDGVLRLVVGNAKLTGGGEAVYADNVYFCPFCGVSLQSLDEVKARVKPS
jgi:hypothetical protein